MALAAAILFALILASHAAHFSFLMNSVRFTRVAGLSFALHLQDWRGKAAYKQHHSYFSVIFLQPPVLFVIQR